MTAIHDLGVTKAKVLEDFRFNKSVHFLISWLRDRYVELVQHSMYEVVARVYMLHLVGCTILADKSHVYINAKYM